MADKPRNNQANSSDTTQPKDQSDQTYKVQTIGANSQVSTDSKMSDPVQQRETRAGVVYMLENKATEAQIVEEQLDADFVKEKTINTEKKLDEAHQYKKMMHPEKTSKKTLADISNVSWTAILAKSEEPKKPLPRMRVLATASPSRYRKKGRSAMANLHMGSGLLAFTAFGLMLQHGQADAATIPTHTYTQIPEIGYNGITINNNLHYHLLSGDEEPINAKINFTNLEGVPILSSGLVPIEPQLPNEQPNLSNIATVKTIVFSGNEATINVEPPTHNNDDYVKALSASVSPPVPPPTVDAPPAFTTDEDVSLVLSGMKVVAPPGTEGSITITLQTEDGVLNIDTGLPGGLSSEQISGNGTATVTITALPGQINLTLGDPNGIIFVPDPNYNGDVPLIITTGGGTVATHIYVVPVNDPAIIGGDLSGTAIEDTVITATGTLTVVDVDVGESAFQPVTTPTASDNGYGDFTISSTGDWTYTSHNSDPVIQQLGAGDTLTDSFTVKSIDGTTQVINITIQGTNDVPVIGGVTTGDTKEDTTTTASGALTINDVDAGQSTFIPVNTAAASDNGYGTYTLDSSGNWVYNLDNSAPVIQQLGAGDTLTDTFTAVSSDGTASQVVTITIHGTNDVPVIGGVTTGDTTEDTTLTTSGALTINDVDAGQSTFIPVSTAAASDNGYGTYTLDSSGNWVYNLDNAAPVIQQLGAGDTLTDTFTAVSFDGTATQQVTITIHGTNDVPTIGGDITGNTIEDNTVTSTGTLTINDIDAGESLFQAVGTATASDNGHGTYTLTSTGEWIFVLDNGSTAVQQLGAGDTLTDTFTAVSLDGTASQVVTITIIGTNDIPIISGAVTGNAIEDTVTTVSGALNITDVDIGESSFQAVGAATASNNGYGTYTLTNTGDWTFVLNNGLPIIQQLGAGETLTDTFTVTSFDGTASQVVTITITGTNDAPVVASAISDQTSNESTTVILDVSGNFSDIDTNDTLTYSATSLPLGLSIDANTGIISGTLDHLASNGSVYTITVTADDGHGGTVSNTFNWTVNNPAPLANNDVQAVTEGGGLYTGSVATNDSDPDSDSLSYALNNAAPAGLTFNNNGGYTFDANNVAYDHLAQGEVLSIGVPYTVTDEQGATATATLTITITGTNDAPVVASAISDQTSNESTAVTLDVSGNFSDVDTTDTLTYSVDVLPPGLSINANTGIISGTLDHLASNGSVYTITVTADDGHGGTVSDTFNWTVNNPAPLANNDAQAVSEGGGLYTGSVATNDSDPDGDSLSYTLNNAAPAGLSFAADGSYTFNVNNVAYDHLAQDEVLSIGVPYTVTDEQGVTATATLTITITGTNDTPVVASAISDQTSNDSDNITLNVSGNFSDVDTSDVLTYSVDVLPPGLSINANTGIISGTLDHLASNGSVYTITVTADDGHGGMVSDTFNWTVNNPAPLANNDAQAVTEGGGLYADSVATNDQDPDGDSLSYALNNPAPAGLTFNNNGGYTFDANNVAYDHLAQGEVLSIGVPYTVTDEQGATATATLTITITGTNDAPIVASAISDQTSNDNDSITLNVSGNFNDVDTTDTLTYSVDVLPPGLSINVNTGIISGTLDHLASNGSVYTITVTADDGHGGTVSDTFNWTVNNPAPLANNDMQAVTEGAGLYTGSVATNDSDPDGDSLSYALNNPAPAGLSFAADGSYTFNANNVAYNHLAQGEVLSIGVPYTVTDEQGAIATATLTITITGTNDAPIVASAISDQTSNDSDNITLNVSGNFSDVDTTDMLTYSVDVLPPGLSINANTGIISGTLDHLASNGSVYTITVTADDGHGGTVSDTFNWTVNNPAPLANNDAQAVTEGAGLYIGSVATNDSDPDGDSLSYALNNPAPAGLSFAADGSYTFNANNVAYDHLAQGEVLSIGVPYTVTDEQGATATATLTITITGTNDTPVVASAISDQTSNDSDNITLNISGNFSDVDTSDVLTYSVDVLPPGLSINANTGIISGTLDHLASNGSVYTITVTADDGHGGTVSDTFNWTVNNPAPLANNDTQAVTEDGGLYAGSVATNDSDPDGDSLSYALNNPAPAGLSFAADGSYTFNANNVAYDHLAQGEVLSIGVPYTVTDEQGATATATLTITITGTNDTPVVASVISDQTSNDSDNITLNVSSNFSDVDTTDTLTYSVDVLPPGLSIDANTGIISGTLDHLASNGSVYTITVTANDGHGGTVSDTFNWTINNPAPIAQDDTKAVTEGNGLYTGSVALNDSDPDGDSLSYALNNAAPAGLTFAADGSYTFDANNAAYDHLAQGQVLSIGVPYTVTDEQGAIATAILTITITGTNDTPVAVADNGSVTEDTAPNPISGNVLTNDTDVDGDTLTVSAVNGSAGNVDNDIVGTYGTLHLSSNGSYTYTLNNSNSTVQALGVGQSTSESFTYTANDGHGGTANATLTVTIHGTNDAPTLDLDANNSSGITGSGYQNTFVYNGGPVVIADTDTTITDVDNTTLQSATVTITNILNAGLETLAATTTGTSISASYNSSTGVLSLTGTDTLAHYQQVLASVTYNNSSSTPNTTDRILNVVVNDGVSASNTAVSTIHVAASLNIIWGSFSNDIIGMVTPVGDVNNDGYVDFMIGALNASPGGVSNAGQAYLILGQPVDEFSSYFTKQLTLTQPTTSYGLTINGTITNEHFSTVGGVGDFNGDGYADMFLGAPFKINNSDNNGSTGFGTLLYGTNNLASTFGTSFDATASNISNVNGTLLNGATVNEGFGIVTTAGDLNGDGLDDFVISTFGNFSNSHTYVIYGTKAGLGASFNISSVNGSNGTAFTHVNSYYNYSGGASVADINGDGIKDLILYEELENSDHGVTYVIYGTATGFGGTGNINLNTLNGTNGFSISGNVASAEKLGEGFAAQQGDINGDGIKDIAMGAWLADPSGNIDAGKVYVLFGSNTPGAFSSNFNITSMMDGSHGFTVSGIAAGDNTGFALSSGGDFNGDGYDDLVIASPGVNSSTGQVAVLFGHSGGFSSNINLSTLNSSDGFFLNGVNAGDQFGHVGAFAGGLSYIGDINGDGFDDLGITAGGYDKAPYTNNGAIYVVYGYATDIAMTGTIGNDTLTGTNGVDVIYGNDGNDTINGGLGNDRLIGGRGDDILNGDVGNDVMIGAAGNDTLTISFTGGNTLEDTLRVDGGTGTDTVTLGGSGITFNMTTYNQTIGHYGTFSNIEVFDINGTNVSVGNTLVLDKLSVLNMTQTPAGTPTAAGIPSSDHILQILGNSNDVLQLSDAGLWSYDGTVTIGAITFDEFHIDNVILQVQQGINTTQFANKPPVNSVPSSLNGLFINANNAITGVTVSDPDARGDNISVTLSVNEGVLTLNTSVSGGIVAGDIVSGNGTNTVTILSSISKINATLTNANGLIYTPNIVNQPDTYEVRDTLTVTTNDLGHNGSGGALIDTDQVLLAMNTLKTFTPIDNYPGEFASDSLTLVTPLGDINHDGYEDFIVGARTASPGSINNAGATYVIYGQGGTEFNSVNLSSLTLSQGFKVTGTIAGGLAGTVGGPGIDFNGDGYQDIMIGAPGKNDNSYSSLTGNAYLLFGSSDLASTFGSSFALSSLNGTNGFVLPGQVVNQGFGIMVGSGDFNGDGLDDFSVGAFGNDPNTFNYVVFGTKSNLGASFNVSGLNGTNGTAFLRFNNPHNYSGIVSNVDFNGDGIDDLVVAEELYNGGYGRVYVIYGSTSGFGAATVNLNNLNGTTGFILNHVSIGIDDKFGQGIANGMGDINGDGIQDLVMGAYRTPNGINNLAGRAYVLFGTTSGMPATSNIESYMDGTHGFTLTGINANDKWGFEQSASGDFNGDGFNDIAIGSLYGNGGTGQVAVIFGHAGAFASNINISSLDGLNGIYINGINLNDQFGGGNMFSANLAYIGDINGDGFDDLGITANGYDGPAGSNSGGMWVIYGFASDISLIGTTGNDTLTGANGVDVIYGDDGNDTINGGLGNDRLIGGRGDDILNGGVGNDVMIGAAGNDTLTISFTGGNTLEDTLKVDGGTGTDTVALGGSGITFNMTTFNQTTGHYNTFTNIEVFDINGTNVAVGNTLVLDKISVLNMTQTAGGVPTAAGIPGSDHILQVLGNSNDIFQFSDLSLWSYDGTVTIGAITFSEFHSDNVIVQVQQGVNVSQIMNDAPVNTLSTGYTTLQGIPLTITGLSITDVDVGTGSLTTSLSVTSGTITATTVGGGAAISGSGTATVTLTGTLTQINTTLAAINAIQYTSNTSFSGTASLTMTTNDNGNTGAGGSLQDIDTVNITVNPTLIINGVSSNNISGAAVGGTGDFSGDGFNDIVIGAPYANTATGSAYLVNGGSSVASPFNLPGINGSNGTTFTNLVNTYGSAQTTQLFGDFNADGRSDIVLMSTNGGTGYVVFGTSSLTNPFNVTTLNGSNGFKTTGLFPLGREATGVDINGDGLTDLALSGGSVYSSTKTAVIFGQTAAMSATLNTTTLNGSNGFNINNLSTTYSVSSVDFNGDGLNDLIMGTQFNNSRTGAVTVVLGQTAAFTSTINAAGLTGTNGANPHGFNIYGATSFGAFGYTVTGLSNFNGDHFGDLLITRANGQNTAYIVYGQSNLANITPGSLTTATFNTVGGLQANTITGPAGTFSMIASSAGDFNGDGYTDALIGVHYSSLGKNEAVYVIYGTPTPSNINLSSLTASQGFKLGTFPVYDQESPVLNWLNGLGDVNGDGYADFAVGASGATPASTSNTNAGVTYVIYGYNSTGSSAQQVGGSSGDTLTSTNAQKILIGGLGDDQLISGAGINTVFHGGAGHDTLTVSFTSGNLDSTLLVDGGSGVDTVSFGSATGINFNLSTLNASTYHYNLFQSIEVFDLKTNGNNTFTVGAKDIFNMVDVQAGLFAGATPLEKTVDGLTHQYVLRVRGDSTDTMNVSDSGWQYNGTVVVTGITYKEYQNGQAYLQIENNINTSSIDNDAPVNTVPATQSVNEDTNLSITGLSVSDVDAGSSNITVTLSVLHGTITVATNIAGGLTAGSITTNGTASVILTGSQTAINATLAGSNAVVYKGIQDYNGPDTLIVLSNDQGFTGAGGAKIDHDTVAITVNSVNDPPAAANDTGIIAYAGMSFRVNVLANDSDPDNNPLTITSVSIPTGTGVGGVPANATTISNGQILATPSSYTPTAYFYTGAFNFTYNISDGQGGTASASVTTTVVSHNIFLTTSTPPSYNPETVILGNNGSSSGAGVAIIGDINGDGYADYIIGSPNDNSVAGTSYIYFGKPFLNNSVVNLSSFTAADGFKLSGAAAGDMSGHRGVSGIGDINGDGYKDFIIDSRLNDAGGTDAGKAYVVLGHSGSYVDANLSTVGTTTAGFTITGRAAGDKLGVSMRDAGDINGDGLSDFIIGAPYNDAAGTNTGEAYVIFGKTGGFSNINLNSLSSTDGFKITGVGTGAQTGWSVDGAGDVNGDGYDDLIVGAPHFHYTTGIDLGRAYVIFGKASGFTDLNMASVSLPTDIVHPGVWQGVGASWDLAGNSVAGIGDINSDGYEDYAVGGPNSYQGVSGVSNNSQPYGDVFIYLGKASGFFNDNTAFSSFRIVGNTDVTYQTGYNVTAAGDFNADGYDDYMVTSIGKNSVQLIYGHAGTFTTEHLVNMPASEGFAIFGAQSGDLTGYSITGAGDINGDGYDDVIVGAPYNDAVGTNSGASYIIYGQDRKNETTQTGTSGVDVIDGKEGDDIIIGGASDDRIIGGLGNDTLDGQGGNDVLIGGAGDDIFIYDPADTIKVDGGAGFDTIKVTGSGVSFSLVAANAVRHYGLYQAIEGIDLIGTGNNTLTLTQMDLLQMTDSPPSMPTVDGLSHAHVLRVTGDSGDSVIVSDAGWSYDGTINISGTTFFEYKNGQAYLQIQQGVSIERPNVNTLTTFDAHFTANSSFTSSGVVVNGMGDFNNDGLMDMLITASNATAPNSNSGSSYLIYGVTQGTLASTVALDGATPTYGVRFSGTAAGSALGTSGELITDFNGDGKSDLALSAPGTSGGGVVYLVNGSNSIASGTDFNFTTTPLTGTNGTQFIGTDDFGVAVASSDLNGDGLSDLIVSKTTGAAAVTYVIFGTTTSLGATFNVSSLNGTNGFSITNTTTNAIAANAGLNDVGDVNRDGFHDLIIGASSRVNNGGAYGAATVIFGHDGSFATTVDANTLTGSNGFNFVGDSTHTLMGSSVAGVGDVNGDGYSDILIGASGTNSAAYLLYGQATYAAQYTIADIGVNIQGMIITPVAGSTIYDVASAGDYNGDGYTDFLVGTKDASNNGTAYLFFGGSSLASSVSLSAFNYTNGIIFNNIGTNEGNQSLSGVGDVDHDGFDDILVGKPNSGTDSSSNLYYGSSGDITQYTSGTGQTFTGTLSHNVMKDSGTNNILNGASGIDNLIGGINSTLKGLAGNDALIGGSGNTILTGGAGNDILWGGAGNNTFKYDINNDGAWTDIIHGAQGHIGSWVDAIDLTLGALNQGPSAALGAVGSWTLVVEGHTLTSATSSGEIDFANSNQLAALGSHDLHGTIQIQVTSVTVETMTFDNIEKVQWHV